MKFPFPHPKFIYPFIFSEKSFLILTRVNFRTAKAVFYFDPKSEAREFASDCEHKGKRKIYVYKSLSKSFYSK
jgi:hypothetical protein